jgi:hypothetical protein
MFYVHFYIYEQCAFSYKHIWICTPSRSPWLFNGQWPRHFPTSSTHSASVGYRDTDMIMEISLNFVPRMTLHCQHPYIFLWTMYVVNTWSTYMKHIDTNNHTTWSTIVNQHGQQSSNNMVKHRQNTWSNIIKHIVNNRQKHGQTS